MTDLQIASTRLRLTRGDITQQDVDAIVNAANSGLMGGGGVDGAIHRAGGPIILDQCQELRRTAYPGGLPTGQAVITAGGRLKARYVIHTVGPIWYGGQSGEPELLAGAYRTSLLLAVEKGLRTIAFPAISTGIYGYPIEQAARVALDTVIGVVKAQPGRLDEIRMVLFSDQDLAVYETALASLAGGE